ncbi:MAG: hypothetical protein JWO67_4179 [Streptosporangiaceae bacterium]|nr:hypothetical protein [Streptosporangiaceae bacterium]
MQFIRYTYGPDVRQFGDEPILVEDVQVATLVDDLRRAVRVTPDELPQMTKPQLLEHADALGVEVPSSALKADVVEAVAEAVAPDETPTLDGPPPAAS